MKVWVEGLGTGKVLDVRESTQAVFTKRILHFLS